MSSVLCFTLRFLDPVPQFHGRGDDGDPEWPPSPLRLFQSLVSAAAQRWRDGQFRDYAQPALQWLERIQPSLVAPPVAAESFGYRMYVPNNSGDLMTAAWARGDTDTSMAKFRVEKDIRPLNLRGEAIRFLFPLPDGACPHFEVLQAAARSVTHLGWGIDMVAGNAELLTDEQAAVLPGEVWRAASDQSGTALRVPNEGTLDALMEKHEKFLGRLSNEGFKPVPPLSVFRIVGYRRESDPVPRPQAVFELRNDDGTRFSYPQATLIHIAGMVRHLAINLLEQNPPDGVPHDWVESFVAGHRAPDVATHRQFSYLPLPSIGYAHTDPAVRRVMIAAPPGNGRWLNHLAKLLAGQQLQPTERTKLDAPPTLVRVRNDNVASYYTMPANQWASVTPVILPGHDDHKPDKTRKLIEKALQQSGIEQECEFEWSAFSYFPKSLSAHKYDRQKRPTGYIRPDHLLNLTAIHLKLRFNNGLKVHSPLSIGSGRHCGLGLMAGIDL